MLHLAPDRFGPWFNLACSSPGHKITDSSPAIARLLQWHLLFTRPQYVSNDWSRLLTILVTYALNCAISALAVVALPWFRRKPGMPGVRDLIRSPSDMLCSRRNKRTPDKINALGRTQSGTNNSKQPARACSIRPSTSVLSNSRLSPRKSTAVHRASDNIRRAVCFSFSNP